MNASLTSTAKRAYGLSFDIEDLVLIREWAAERCLRLTIALDHTSDGVEFEELLLLHAASSREPTLTIWRTGDNFFAQPADRSPQRFTSVGEILARLRPAQARRAGWRPAKWIQRMRAGH